MRLHANPSVYGEAGGGAGNSVRSACNAAG
jgi:hypothetical protein